MRIKNISLATRISAMVLLLVAFTCLWWLADQSGDRREDYRHEATADLQAALQVKNERLTHAIEALRQNTLFLAALPPVSGIARASLHQGFDPRDRNSYATWEARLQQIFSDFLLTHPDYSRVRYIGVADNGMELVRVENRSGQIEVATHQLLEAKAGRDYFQSAQGLPAGKVSFSAFSLEQANGQLVQPYRRKIRASTPVFDENGQHFGMIVLDRDVQPLLDTVLQGLPSGVEAYVADRQGRYLLHPDTRRDFEFERGSEQKITDDFPLLAGLFSARPQQELPLQGLADGSYLTAERISFDAQDPARFLLLAYRIPPAVVAEHTKGIDWPDIAKAFTLSILLSALLMLILRRTFEPLTRITQAAEKIAAGNRELRLVETGGGELRLLIQTLNTMLDKLADRQLIRQESTFRKELIESLPGMFYMTDSKGKFMLWNRNLEKVLRCSSEELPRHHPLDFLAGEDKVVVASALQQVFVSGTDMDVDATLVALDGTRTPYHFTGRRILRDGQWVLVGLGMDISERKQAEQELREHEAVLAQFKDTLDYTQDGVFIFEPDSLRFVYVNRGAIQQVGYSEAELLKMTPLDIKPEYSEPEFRAMLQPLRDGMASSFEAVHRHKDGHDIPVEIMLQLVQRPGAAPRYVAFVRDITERKRVEQALRESESHLRLSQLSGGIATWEADLINNRQKWSENSHSALGFPVLSNPTWDDFMALIYPEDRQRVLDAAQSHINQGTVYDLEFRIVTTSGEIRWMRSAGYVERDRDGKPVLMRGIGHDVTERKLFEEQLKIAAVAFETHDAIMITDAHANIIKVNRAFTEITGYYSDEVIGENPRFMNSGKHEPSFYAGMWQELLATGSWSGEIWDRRKNGELYPKWMVITAIRDEQGKTTQYVAIFSDITTRKQAESEIHNLAFYDALTQLPNRRLLNERLSQALLASKRRSCFGALMFLDLDNFKPLNDQHGHVVGDLLLIEVANRLKECVREMDTVARFGGDEFVVMLGELDVSNADSIAEAGRVAEKIRVTLSESYLLTVSKEGAENETVEHRCSASIGVAIFHGDQAQNEVLKWADAAMYQAKAAGRNAIRFYAADSALN